MHKEDMVDSAKMVSVRDVYGEVLARIGDENKDVVVLEADCGHSSKSVIFSQRHPDRYFNVGIAEGNMLAMAAGFAACGKIPFVNAFAVFVTLRAGDPLRTLVAYANLNVKLAAAYGGLSDSFDGATHQSVEDIAIARTLPNMTVVVPTDASVLDRMMPIITDHRGPVFLRLSRAALPVILPEGHPFVLGKANVLREGSDVTIIACGYMVHKALAAAAVLQRSGIRARVIEMHTIKPLDVDMIVKAARETGYIVTVEEHSIYGGLGSAVAEVVSARHPVPVEIIGIPDRFGESGDYEALLAAMGLDENQIASRVQRLVRQSVS